MLNQQNSKTHLQKSFIGIVERVSFHNEQNGWSVLKVSSLHDSEDVKTVLIHQAKVFAGATMEFWGEWSQHSKYGEQFKATHALEKKPASAAALEKYLGSGLIKGVGPATAKQIVSYFKENTLNVFENNIEDLMSVSGIAEKKILQIKSSWNEHRAIRDVMIFLQGYGVSTLFATKIYKFYGDRAIQIVTQNPYRLAHDIYGIGFNSADQIALAMGFDRLGDFRVDAGIKQVLLSSKDDGHCYLTEEQILKETSEILKENITKDFVLKRLESLIGKDQIKLRVLDASEISDQNINCYYSKNIYFEELEVAERLNFILKQVIRIDLTRVQNWIERYCAKNEISLSDEQLLAICGIVEKSFSVLTGGPGVGKTTCTKVLVQLLVAMNKNVLLAAPTGRAAQRMTEVMGLESKTIHRLLEWNPQLNTFMRDETNPLVTDFLIVDETSMLDISLACSLFKAIPDRAQVLFIGDPDQLPAVGAGDVLSDLLKSTSVPRFRLTKVFRQAQESLIIRYAHKINKGETPEITSPIAIPKAFQEGQDCLFVDVDDIRDGQDVSFILEKAHPLSTLHYGLNAVETVMRLYIKTIPEWLGKNTEIQILSPQLRGSLGTLNLNQQIQKVANPESPHKAQMQFGSKLFRVGDRVIQTRNNYDLSVFNGDIGRIISINSEVLSCEVDFFGKESRRVLFKKEDLVDLSLAYSITVHKSQGSEFQAVIIPVLEQHYNMLYRNIVYTGLTRAKMLAIFVGTRKAFSMAVQKIEQRNRQTGLAKLIGIS